MSITKLTQAYNEILSGYALSQDVSPLFYYNKDKWMIDSVLEDKMLPTFYAKYNSTGDVAIVLRRGSYDCFLFGKPDENNEKKWLKQSWGMLSDEELLHFMTGLYKYIDLQGIKTPSLSKIASLLGDVTIEDEFRFEELVSLKELKNAPVARKPKKGRKDKSK